jgi:5-methylcytosine-specific restriction protein A
MNRKKFIESHGASCDNWTWSWSFVNEAKRFVIFGAWDRLISGRRVKIFSKSWVTNAKGNTSKGYNQSLEHIRLIQEEGYQLFTFAMQPLEETWQDDAIPKIKSL